MHGKSQLNSRVTRMSIPVLFLEKRNELPTPKRHKSKGKKVVKIIAGLEEMLWEHEMLRATKTGRRTTSRTEFGQQMRSR